MLKSVLSDKVEIREKSLNGKGIFAKVDLKEITDHLYIV